MFLFSQMGRGKTDSDYKSHLVEEICRLHHHWNQENGQKRPFLDFYRVLKVDENAGGDIIRKNYLKLALLLHPDKNKHPKADIAFKLVSEAYACLSDNARRKAFNVERKNYSSVKINEIHQNQKCTPLSTSSTKQRARCPKMLQRMKDLRARFQQEANVIENCLKTNNAASRNNISVSSRKELPIFNPSDYLSQGYPHYTTYSTKNLEKFRHFKSKDHVLQALRVVP